MSEERTEQATPKRRKEARKRGEIPRSTELTAAVGLLATVAFFRWYGPYAADGIGAVMRGSFTNLHQPDMTSQTLQMLLMDNGMAFARIIAPLMALVMVVGVGVSVGQGGFVFSTQQVKPQFNRINPASGFKRILSKRGAFDTVKAIFKLVVVGAVAWPLLREDVERFAALTGADPAGVGTALADAVSQLALRASAAYFVLAVVDYGYQRWEFEKKLRMTLQEVKEELRTTEGNPEIKSRIRRIQRQLARGRMMQDLPSATVVVTNPTHIAVAIKFDLMTMSAPVVVAKGSGKVAEKIKERARLHAIPVLENKPLARALFKMADVGGEIPVGLYEAVADVIAYVYRLRTRR